MTDSAAEKQKSNNAPLPIKRPFFDRYQHLFFALACSCVIIFFVAGYYQSNLSLNALSTVRENSEHIDRVERLMTNLVDAQTGVRGFIIGKEEQFLDHYQAAIDMIKVDLASIQDITYEEFDIIKKTRDLEIDINEQLAVFEEYIDKVDDGEAFLVDSLEDSEESFDLIRVKVDDIKQALIEHSNIFYYDAVSSQRVIQYSILILSLCALGFLIWLFSNIQKHSKLKLELAETLSKQNEKLESAVTKRTVELSRLATQLTRVSELEKQRLARELHDDMGASLTAAKMDASSLARTLRQSDDEKVQKRADRLLTSLDHAISLKRRLTTDLLPPLLEQLGLHEALRSLGEDLAHDPDFDVTINIPEQQPEFDEETALSLFRITQEAITNIRKYSKATKVDLIVELTADKHTLTIRDNGIGFEPKNVSENRYGLVGMRHRAKMNGAKIKIKSAKGEGTTILVESLMQCKV